MSDLVDVPGGHLDWARDNPFEAAHEVRHHPSGIQCANRAGNSIVDRCKSRLQVARRMVMEEGLTRGEIERGRAAGWSAFRGSTAFAVGRMRELLRQPDA